jgi:hypothetical protein
LVIRPPDISDKGPEALLASLPMAELQKWSLQANFCSGVLLKKLKILRGAAGAAGTAGTPGTGGGAGGAGCPGAGATTTGAINSANQNARFMIGVPSKCLFAWNSFPATQSLSFVPSAIALSLQSGRAD